MLVCSQITLAFHHITIDESKRSCTCSHSRTGLQLHAKAIPCPDEDQSEGRAECGKTDGRTHGSETERARKEGKLGAKGEWRIGAELARRENTRER